MSSISAVQKHTERGFTVLIATVVVTIVLAIGLSILDITLKQVVFAGVARSSEIAFQAADAAMECVRFNDVSTAAGGAFDIPDGPLSAECFEVTADNSGSSSLGGEQSYTWEWDGVCSIASVYKFYSDTGDADMDAAGITTRDCPQGVTCTVVKARGYDRSCANIGETGTVERELTLVY